MAAAVSREVTYIDQRVEVGNDHLCVICQDETKRDYYILHSGASCQTNAVHRSCAKQWIKANPTCPTGCGSRVTNTLESRAEKILTGTKIAANNAAFGGKQIENDYFFCIIALASVAALEFSGMRGIKNALAVAGFSYGAAMGIGYLWGRGPQSGADERISTHSPIAALTGATVSLLAWCAGHIQIEHRSVALPQILAVSVLMKAVGFRPLILSTAVGAISSGLLGRTFQFAKDYAPALGGALGALINVQNAPWLSRVNVESAPWFISCLALKSGFTIGSIAAIALKSFGDYSPIAAGAIGAGGAAMASILINRGYRAFKNL